MHNVLIVGPFPENLSLIRGGVQASVFGLARALRVRSDISNVQVMSLPVTGTTKPKVPSASLYGIDVTFLRAYGFLATAVVHLPLILRQALKKKNTIVHIHGTGLVQAALLAVLRIRRIKAVWTLHGITEKETLHRYNRHGDIPGLLRHVFYMILERFSLLIAQRTIVDTEYVADELGYGDNLYTIAQGIFCGEFIRMQDTPRHKPLVLSIGVFTPRKGHHLTIEAFAEVRKKLPEAKLVIAGAQSDEHYYNQLKEQVIRLGLSDSIVLDVDLPRPALLALLASARVFALHSEEESQGIALCEALAAGLPVVASNVGGIPFIIDDQKNGILVEYGDIKKFAAALFFLLANNELHNKMSASARTASARFDWKNMSDDIIKVYNSF